LAEESIEKIKNWLKDKPSILLTSHHNPDGDAIGSLLGLYLYFKKLGFKVWAVIPNEYPDFLKWLPGHEEIIVFEKFTGNRDFIDADVVFSLDYNSPKRVGSFESSLKATKGKKILIDHHPQPDQNFYDVMISTVETSSTSELVYSFITKLSGTKEIDQQIAKALYVGIMTDTGSFAFNCNYPSTFKIIAEMLELGLDGEYIHRLVYDNYSESRLRLLGLSLREKLTVLPEYCLAYIWLTSDDLLKYDYKIGDTEGVVNYPLSIKEVKISILLIERKDKIRVSFRSKGEFPVNIIARDHFEGGGHRNAAGGDSYMSMEETIKKLKNILPQYKELIERSSLRTKNG
jgi:phosphoesterase RecJ-like protein